MMILIDANVIITRLLNYRKQKTLNFSKCDMTL
jgi:hypothetical protein